MLSRLDSRQRQVLILLLAMFGLADCGGGGGATPSSTAPPPSSGPPPPSGPPPNLSGLTVTGAVDHNSSVTINGSGFGVKASAAPVVWDNASGSDISQKWDGAWPSLNPPTNTAYRAEQRGIALPHNRINRYIAGAHHPGNGFDNGYNVMFWKNRTITSYPAYTYASWYQRLDNVWDFGQGNPADDNLKIWDLSMGTSPYTFPENWYLEYNPRPTSTSSVPEWHLLDDALGEPQQALADPATFWGSTSVNPMAGQWTKIEIEIRYSNQPDGYIKLWEDGILKFEYNGSTDRYAGTDRSEAIGGFARSASSNNWRYFADVYLDYSRARVVLANNVTLSQATVIENQIPTSWSDTSITVTVNLGRFTPGPAYLFVVNPSGQVNASGLPVVLP